MPTHFRFPTKSYFSITATKQSSSPFLQINELLARVAKNVSVPGNASPDIRAAGVAAEAAIAAQGLTGICTNDDFARHIVSKKNRSVLLWTKTALL